MSTFQNCKNKEIKIQFKELELQYLLYILDLDRHSEIQWSQIQILLSGHILDDK